MIPRSRIALLTGALLMAVAWAAAPVAAQNCPSFANTQIQLADRQISQGNYGGALRALDVAGKNCGSDSVEDKVAETLTTWYDNARSEGALLDVIRAVRSASHLSGSDRASLDRRILRRIGGFVSASYSRDNFRETYQTCQRFGGYTDRTFTMNYRCGVAAQNVQAYNGALERYAWLLDNWASDQSLTTQTQILERRQTLYLLTARFDEGLETLKMLAMEDPEPSRVLESVVAIRGKYLEPIAQIGAQFLNQDPPEGALKHARGEMSRINFPTYVEAIYTMDPDGTPTSAFYGESAVQTPDAAMIDRSVKPTSLLQAPGTGRRSWLLASMNGGYVVVQFNQDTTSEENVILEGLLGNVQEESRWQDLYEAEFRNAYPSTGSAVATFIGGAYLADASLTAYDAIFEAGGTLTYFCVQGRAGEIKGSHAFSRSAIGYEENVWDRTSKTPALFHHEIQRNGTPLREVVWPTYDGQTWSGVVRIGIASNR